MSFSFKTTFSIVLAVIVFAAAGIYLYEDTVAVRERNGTVDGENLPEVSLATSTAYSSKSSTTAKKGDEEVVVSLPLPNLSRPYSIPSSFPEEFRKNITSSIQETVARLKINPGLLADWLSLGVYYKTIGDYEGAREAWEYASAIRPKNYISFSNLGDLYHYYLKDYPHAELNLLKVVANEPTNIASYKNLYDLYTLSYKEKAPEAPRILERGLMSNPHSTDLLSLLGDYYRLNGNPTIARTYYLKALEESKNQGNTSLQGTFEKLLTDLAAQ